MTKPYVQQLIVENKKNDVEATNWLHCFMTNTPPNYKDCAEFLSTKDLRLTKALYKKILKERCCPSKKPSVTPEGH